MDLDDKIRKCINLSLDNLSPIWPIILLQFISFVIYVSYMELKVCKQLDKSCIYIQLSKKCYFKDLWKLVFTRQVVSEMTLFWASFRHIYSIATWAEHLPLVNLKFQIFIDLSLILIQLFAYPSIISCTLAKITNH